ncbi:MAG TPA: hypothetical protein DC012_00760 [Escherichia sp.]|uniref:DUF6056 family protein n=1 Tax=Pseudescherichia vulneris TaxID=566 RepID=UPI000E943C32|nr:DUF6056 family protein [Pseudescherichia vulneris]HBC80510.1 hypothetical protein [Escherichia sp.]
MSKILRSAIYVQGAIIFCIYAITFHFSPLNGEDYGLTKRFTSESISERISWALAKSSSQIQGWNARLGEQLSIFSLSMPEYFFHIVAIISIAGLCYLLARLLYDEKNKLNAFITSILITFLLWPGFELFLWRTVITGYTVPMIITLMVVKQFINKNRRKKLCSNKKILSIYCALAFLSGLSFENVPVATMLFLVSVLFSSKEIISRLIFIPLSILFGWVALMLAPSTVYRRMKYHEWYHHNVSFLDDIKSRALDVVTIFAKTSSVLFVVALTSFTYLLYKKDVQKEHFLLIVCAVLVVGSMIASPYTEPRSYMFAWCVMLAFVISAIQKNMGAGNYGGYALLIIGFFSIYMSMAVYRVNHKFYNIMQERSLKIELQLNSHACKQGIKVNLVKGFKKYRYLNNRDEWYYYNLPQVSEYYGCKIVG